jgi:hypothetical protein
VWANTTFRRLVIQTKKNPQIAAVLQQGGSSASGDAPWIMPKVSIAIS